MIDINCTTLTGRLVSEPRIYNKGDSVGFALFTLASNQSYKNRDGSPQQETAFVNCKTFGMWAAELEGRKKGDLVIVAGRLKTETWEKNGENHTQLTLVCHTVHPLTRSPKPGTFTANKTDKSVDGEGNPIPF
jgi:single-strand DNA-binding protein